MKEGTHLVGKKDWGRHEYLQKFLKKHGDSGGKVGRALRGAAADRNVDAAMGSMKGEGFISGGKGRWGGNVADMKHPAAANTGSGGY